MTIKTLAYETNRGNLKVVRGEWTGQHGDLFKTEDGKWLTLRGDDAIVAIVRTPKGGLTERKLGYLA